MTATLGELASRFGCRLIGEGATPVARVSTLKSAGPDAVSFLANPLYRRDLAETQAAAVILHESVAGDSPVACLVAENPYARYAEIAAYLHPSPEVPAGLHPDASVDATADVDAGASVGPRAVVGAGARIASGVVIGAGSTVGAGVQIGVDTRLAPQVCILDSVVIGARCIINSGTVIGADGFGFAQEDGRWIKVPQIGRVVIGDDVEIGANTTVDRGSIEDTVIGDGVKLDNLVQIAHNVHIGAHTVMAAMSGAAGSTRIGQRCMFGGGVVTTGHLTICDDVMFTFRSVVTHSVSEPGTYGGSLPAEEASKWRRNAARFRQLDQLHKRLQKMARSIQRMTGKPTEND